MLNLFTFIWHFNRLNTKVQSIILTLLSFAVFVSALSLHFIYLGCNLIVEAVNPTGAYVEILNQLALSDGQWFLFLSGSIVTLSVFVLTRAVLKMIFISVTSLTYRLPVLRFAYYLEA